VSALCNTYSKYSNFIIGYNSFLNFDIAPKSSAILLGRNRSTTSVAACTKQKLTQLNSNLSSNKKLTLQKKVNSTK
jgi:hypothetical protein